MTDDADDVETARMMLDRVGNDYWKIAAAVEKRDASIRAAAIRECATICEERGATLIRLDYRHAAAECAWCYHEIRALLEKGGG